MQFNLKQLLPQHERAPLDGIVEFGGGDRLTIEPRHHLRRRAVGRKPDDVWHIDLTAVPRRAGFRIPGSKSEKK